MANGQILDRPASVMELRFVLLGLVYVACGFDFLVSRLLTLMGDDSGAFRGHPVHKWAVD